MSQELSASIVPPVKVNKEPLMTGVPLHPLVTKLICKLAGKSSVNDDMAALEEFGLLKVMVTVEGAPTVTVSGVNDLPTETGSELGITVKVATASNVGADESGVVNTSSASKVSVKMPIWSSKVILRKARKLFKMPYLQGQR